MSRARIRNIEQYNFNLIDSILDVELNKIAYMYFIQHISELDIAFSLNTSEKTIYRRIKEIKEIIGSF